MRIVIAGGGTGGHLYPGLAVAEALGRRWPDTEVLFVGTRRGIESRVVPEAGYPFRPISVRGFPRSLSLDVLRFGFSLARGIGEAWSILRSWKPAVVVGTGGYASVPAAWMSVLLRIPLVLLEQNRIPGLATRVTARWARLVCLTYAESAEAFGGSGNLMVTGNPVRRSLVEKEAIPGDPGIVRVLVVGGSRGAHQINVLLTEALACLPENLPVEFVVQTGTEDRDWVEERFSASGVTASAHAYLDPIEDAYAKADLVICRAGATTLGELTARGLPGILIPYPYAAAGHQDASAEVLSKRGAAEVLDSRTVRATDLAGAIRRLVEDRDRRENMAAEARAMGKPEAADEVAGLIGELIKAA